MDFNNCCHLVIDGITNVVTRVGGPESRENQFPHNIIAVNLYTSVWFQDLAIAEPLNGGVRPRHLTLQNKVISCYQDVTLRVARVSNDLYLRL